MSGRTLSTNKIVSNTHPYDKQRLSIFNIFSKCRYFLAYQLFPLIVPCQAILAACILVLFAATVQTLPAARMMTILTSSLLLFTWTVCYVRAVFSRNPSLPSEAWLSAREFDEYVAWKIRYEKALATGELRQQARKFSADTAHHQFVINDPALRQPRFICGRAFLMAAKQRKWITFDVQKRYMKQLPLDELRDMAAQASPAEFVARVCEKCRAVLPDRAWHCNCCNKCVLKFYHHCPMLRNCIAYKNLKIYILFLGYQLLLNVQTLFACVLILLVLLQPGLPLPILDTIIGRNPQTPPATTSDFMPLALNWWFVVLIAGASAPFYTLNTVYISWLLAIHAKWIAQNQTEHEYHRPAFFGSGRFAYSTFDLGSAYQNFVQVFGHNPLLWCSPMNTSIGNGIDYPVRNYAPASVWNIGTSAAVISVTDHVKDHEPFAEQFSQNIDDAAGASKVERAHLKMLAKEAELSGISADSQVIDIVSDDVDSDHHNDNLGTANGHQTEQTQSNMDLLQPADEEKRFLPGVFLSAFRNIFGSRASKQDILRQESDKNTKSEIEAAIRASDVEQKQRQQELERWQRKQSNLDTAVPITVIGDVVRTSSPLKRKIDCVSYDDSASRNLIESYTKSTGMLRQPPELLQRSVQRHTSLTTVTDETSAENDDADLSQTTSTTVSYRRNARVDTSSSARDTEYEADVENNIQQFSQKRYLNEQGDLGDDVRYDGGAGSSVIDALSQRSVYDPHSSAGSSYFPVTTATEYDGNTTCDESETSTRHGGYHQHHHKQQVSNKQSNIRTKPNNSSKPVKTHKLTKNYHRQSHDAAVKNCSNTSVSAYDEAASPVDYYFGHDDKQRLFMHA